VEIWDKQKQNDNQVVIRRIIVNFNYLNPVPGF
jgi:hypothetical protein